MKVFIGKIVLLGCVVSVIVFALSSVPDWRYDFKNGGTESNLFLIPTGRRYDIVLLGTSHGRIFSRSGNHARVENILGASILNLSMGGGRGAYATRIFFDYFLRRGNTADTIVYFIDPWVLYSSTWNEENDLFSDEPITFDFLTFIIRRGVNVATIANYLKTKISWDWVTRSPIPDTENANHLDSINNEAVARRIESLYPDGLSETNFRKYREELKAIMQTAKDRRVRLVFIIPTTLLGDLSGEDALKQTLADSGAEWYDLSNAVTDPRLYSDHDHLNTKGIVQFTEDYLRPILLRTESIPR